MKTKSLFIVTALIEVGAGLTLALAPLVAVALVFGTRIDNLACKAVQRPIRTVRGRNELILSSGSWSRQPLWSDRRSGKRPVTFGAIGRASGK